MKPAQTQATMPPIAKATIVIVFKFTAPLFKSILLA